MIKLQLVILVIVSRTTIQMLSILNLDAVMYQQYSQGFDKEMGKMHVLCCNF